LRPSLGRNRDRRRDRKDRRNARQHPIPCIMPRHAESLACGA
jgi:hypothetical protein